MKAGRSTQKRKALGSKTMSSRPPLPRPAWNKSGAVPEPLPPQSHVLKKRFTKSLGANDIKEQERQASETTQSKDAIGYLYSPDTTPGAGFSVEGFNTQGWF